MGFSSYVGVPRSISASCSRLASSPGLSQVGGSHWVCLEKGRQTNQQPFLFHSVPSLQLSNSNPETAIALVTTPTSLPHGSSRSSPLDLGLFSSWVGGQLFWVLEGMEEASPAGYWSPQALAENSTKKVKRKTGAAIRVIKAAPSSTTKTLLKVTLKIDISVGPRSTQARIFP